MTYRMDTDELIDYGLWQGSSPDTFHMHKIAQRTSRNAEDGLLDGFAPSMMIGATGELNIGEDNEVIYPGYEYQYWAYLPDEEMETFRSGPPNDGYEAESEEARLEVFPTNPNVPRQNPWPTVPETTEEPGFVDQGSIRNQGKTFPGIADFSNASGPLSDIDLGAISPQRRQMPMSQSTQQGPPQRRVRKLRAAPNPQASYTGRI